MNINKEMVFDTIFTIGITHMASHVSRGRSLVSVNFSWPSTNRSIILLLKGESLQYGDTCKYMRLKFTPIFGMFFCRSTHRVSIYQVNRIHRSFLGHRLCILRQLCHLLQKCFMCSIKTYRFMESTSDSIPLAWHHIQLVLPIWHHTLMTEIIEQRYQRYIRYIIFCWNFSDFIECVIRLSIWSYNTLCYLTSWWTCFHLCTQVHSSYGTPIKPGTVKAVAASLSEINFDTLEEHWYNLHDHRENISYDYLAGN